MKQKHYLYDIYNSSQMLQRTALLDGQGRKLALNAVFFLLLNKYKTVFKHFFNLLVSFRESKNMYYVIEIDIIDIIFF